MTAHPTGAESTPRTPGLEGREREALRERIGGKIERLATRLNPDWRDETDYLAVVGCIDAVASEAVLYAGAAPAEREAMQKAVALLAQDEHTPESDLCEAEAEGNLYGCASCRAAAVLLNALAGAAPAESEGRGLVEWLAQRLSAAIAGRPVKDADEVLESARLFLTPEQGERTVCPHNPSKGGPHDFNNSRQPGKCWWCDAPAPPLGPDAIGSVARREARRENVAALVDELIEDGTVVVTDEEGEALIDRITDLAADEIRRLTSYKVAHDEISKRLEEAQEYCSRYIGARALGRNVWHAILDDAVRLRAAPTSEAARLADALDWIIREYLPRVLRGERAQSEGEG